MPSDAAIPTNDHRAAQRFAGELHWFPINPAGPGGVSSALGQIWSARHQSDHTAAPDDFVNPDGLAGTFEHAGDILAVAAIDRPIAVPELARRMLTVQQQNGISDEMYEWLPQQVMSLLRVSDSPRYVIYSYGQTLKPAPNGIYTGSGPFFGMVTNYQVVAESATRAVVHFNGTRVNNIVLTNQCLGPYYWITCRR